MYKYVNLDDGTRIYTKLYTGKKFNKFEPKATTLVFLPGGPGNVDFSLYEAFWSSLNGALDGSLQVVFMDHRGTGGSFIVNEDEQEDYGDPSSWNLEQWGKDVKEVCEKLNLENIILAGVSCGGVVATSAACQFPDFFKGLILCDTDSQFDLERVKAKYINKALEAGASEDDANFVGEVAERTLKAPTPENYQEYQRVCYPYYARNPYSPEKIAACRRNVFCTLQYNAQELLAFDFRSQLAALKFPTMILTGDENPVHNYESALESFQALPEGLRYFRHFVGAGSPVYADEHDLVVSCLQDFVSYIANNRPQPSVVESYGNAQAEQRKHFMK